MAVENDEIDDYDIGVDWQRTSSRMVDDGTAAELTEQEGTKNKKKKKDKAKKPSGPSKLEAAKNRMADTVPSLDVMVIPTYPTDVGIERFRADYKQFSTLLLVCSACVTLTWLPELTSAPVPQAGADKLEWAIFVAAGVQTLVGAAGTMVGALGAFYDVGHSVLTLVLIGLTQMAWIPTIVQVVHLAMACTASPENNVFVPYALYFPTSLDVAIFGSMAVVSSLVYSIASIGPVTFSAFALYAYQRGQYSSRAAAFFRRRAFFYNLLVVLAGATLLCSTVFAQIRYAGTLKPEDPLLVGMYLISNPVTSMAIACVQLLYGAMGICRTLRKVWSKGEWNGGNSERMSLWFPLLASVLWMLMLCLQVIYPFRLEWSLSDQAWGGSAVSATSPASMAANLLGLVIMPLFLDSKLKVTPEEFEKDHYGDLDFIHNYSDSQGIFPSATLSNSGSFSP